MIGSGDYDFSFSGLKTAVRYLLPKHDPIPVEDVCASFQEAVVDVLVSKTLGAIRAERVRTLAISGGVSCNLRLRERFAAACHTAGVELLVAPPVMCTDNAAMIAYVAALKLEKGTPSLLAAEIEPTLNVAAWLKA
jgi:N6-L-threonylcarbamoyladenine synthase